jgi:Glycerol-3-phosphate responsive antiterminator (mRNA-binding)
MPMPRLGYYCAQGEPAKNAGPELTSGPIIASVVSEEAFGAALAAPTGMLYLLIGNPLTLPGLLKRAQDHGKVCIANLDFLEGLTRDRSAVEFLAAHGCAGIVSTHVETLKTAKAMGLKTVQRTFAIDHAAVKVIEKSLAWFVPDAVEVLPAMAAPRVGRRLRRVQAELTIVGGGLIENVKEIEDILAAGVNAITTSNPRLWMI